MSEGRRIAEWDGWAMWMALYANSVREKGSQTFEPNDFHPYYAKPKPRHDMSILKTVFVDGKVPEGI